ncbi:SDR family NAD(P)-dependent oxidoreductase [Periweissella cryptocerci]|uniref:SDR family NAD(P)-dependent oxidoreductase n=1 Tax=Periweissella cryptocerci TaxID=2506420 RepID=A0A4P6YRS3_9LACO|nr:oxidoreductase [Periweissella cryptocerci]QBO35354.1 SDR family NAD(P)-dependent oxidoreductase [Periweissella cryptocerci]
MLAKVILITGASTGIGYATAQRLAKAGHIVYGGARRIEKMNSLKSLNMTPLQLDVTNDESVRNAVKTVIDEQGRIDVLINNAGYGSYGSLEDTDLAEAQRQLDVNLIGVARMMKAVLPFMRQANQGQILNVSSMGGLGYGWMGAWYHASKHGLEALTDTVRLELTEFNIQLSTIEPSATESEWIEIAIDNLNNVAASGTGAYEKQTQRAITMMREGFKDVVPADHVAIDMEKAIKSKNPKHRYPTGRSSRFMKFAMRFISDRMIYKLTYNAYAGK